MPRKQLVEKMAVALAKEHLVSKGVEIVPTDAVGEGFQLAYVDDGALVFADVIGAQGRMPAPPADDDREAVLESLRVMRRRYGLETSPVRYDVITVEIPGTVDGDAVIRRYEDCFGCQEKLDENGR